MSVKIALGPAGLPDMREASPWRELALQVEDLGYHALAPGDHVDDRPAPGELAAALACWTTELHISVLMYCNDYRNPVLLAREVQTLAMLAPGRVEFGLGAGWLERDYQRLGIDFDPPGVRIDRLDRATARIRETWHEMGTEAPPLIMGGGGTRMLDLAAREADIVSVNVRLAPDDLRAGLGATATRDATAAKIKVIQHAAQAAGRDGLPSLQSVVHHVEVTADREAGMARAARTLDVPPEALRASPHVLVGTPAELADRILELHDTFGFDYFNLPATHAIDFAPVLARLS